MRAAWLVADLRGSHGLSLRRRERRRGVPVGWAAAFPGRGDSLVPALPLSGRLVRLAAAVKVWTFRVLRPEGTGQAGSGSSSAEARAASLGTPRSWGAPCVQNGGQSPL